VVVCIGVVGLTAAGCSTPATAAASVGDVTIAESVIFDRTSAMVEQAEATGGGPLDPAAIASANRAETTSAIRSQLLQAVADENGIVVTDEQVNATLASGSATDAVSQLPQSTREQTVRDLLRLEGLVSEATAGGVPITNVTVTIDGLTVANRDEAVATRTQFLTDPASVDATIAASQQPLQVQTFSVLDNPGVASTGVFNAAPGDVIVYPNQNGYFVVRILDRTQEPAVLTAADVQASQSFADLFDLGALLLVPYAQTAGVSVNPRLGVWDPLTLQVVPGGSGL
jgi:hypothetical protein